MKITIIGSGNVAAQLAEALVRQGAEVVQLYARRREVAEEIASPLGIEVASTPEELAEADLYLVALSDRAIGEVVAQLPLPEGAVVAHTAGSVEMDVLAPHPHRGVFYPFQTFTRGRKVEWSRVPILIEGSDSFAVDLLGRVASLLSCEVHRANGEKRRKLHLVGVFACNFVNALYGVGEELLHEADLPFDLLKPLIEETARKAVEASSPCQVQTGPAVRGDRAVQERHLEMLADDPNKQAIYQQISQLIWETSKRISPK